MYRTDANGNQVYDPCYFTEERLDQFIANNRSACEDLCKDWGLEIKTVEELRQAADYLLNQI